MEHLPNPDNSIRNQKHDYNSAKLDPGSKKAIELGCICQQDPKSGSFLIHDTCPLHWHISLIRKISDIHIHMLSKDKLHSTLLGGLVILASFAILLQLT